MSEFKLTKADIGAISAAAVIISVVSKLFYDSFLISLIFSPLIFVNILFQRKKKQREKIREIGMQFKDAIISVAANLKAGYSVENAFIEAVKDMEMLYGEKSGIYEELTTICKGMKSGITLEELIKKFAQRSGNIDIKEFSEVFSLSKRSGGNIIKIISDTAVVISERMETEQQIRVRLSSKRLESRVMELIPIFIIFYITVTNKGYFSVLYHNLFGNIFMTVILAVYVFSCMMIERIVLIEV